VDKREIVFHVGLGKCGSTFLQKNYFPKIEGWEYQSTHQYIDKRLRFIFELNRQFDQVGSNADFLRFSAPFCSGKIVKKWSDEVNAFLKRSNENILISSEGLCGVGYNPLRNNLDICFLLKDLFPGKIKIIFFFRKQSDYCEAQYKQLVYRENRFRKHLSFNEVWSERCTSRSLATIGELNWLRIVENYQNCFGQENVLALPHEMMKENLSSFKEKLDNFLGIRVAVSPNFYDVKENKTPDSVKYKRIFSKGNDTMFSKLDEGLKYQIDSYHVADNMRLSKAIGVNLHNYGYY